MILLLLLIPPVQPDVEGVLDFERLSMADAVRLDGTMVRVQFVIAHPPYEVAGLVVVCPEYFEDEERPVVLRGLPDVWKGQRIYVTGRLRVRYHGDWNEIRIDGRVK